MQIYYNKNYIPFDLYINSIYNIFKTNDFFTVNNFEVSIINNICDYSKDTDFLILFLNYVKDIFYLDTNNTKIIFIHADYIINHSNDDQIAMYDYLNKKNKDNSYIWDYSILNLNYYNEHFSNKKIYFIPLLHNEYLEDIYNKFKLNIPHNEKPIDVLFMGNNSRRREMLLDKISKKHNLYIMTNVNDIGDYISIIDKSKIIITFFSKEENYSFDWYRLSFLYSNKIFAIHEYSPCHDYLEDVTIKTDYDNILNVIAECLNKSENEIELIKEKTYERYKKNDMSLSIIDFFKPFLI